MNLRRTQEAMPLKLKIAQLTDFLRIYQALCYGKEISLFYCGFTLWYLFHFKCSRYPVFLCFMCKFNFDRPLALVNVYTLPRIACEGLPRSGD